MTTVLTDRATAEEIAARTLRDGGATVSVKTLDSPRHGYAVALPYCGRVLLASDHDGSLWRLIGDYVSEYRAQLAPTGHYLGTWLPGDGFIHLDVVEVVHDLPDALTRASARGEVAVYDLHNHVDIPVEVPAYL